MTQPTVSKHC